MGLFRGGLLPASIHFNPDLVTQTVSLRSGSQANSLRFRLQSRLSLSKLSVCGVDRKLTACVTDFNPGFVMQTVSLRSGSQANSLRYKFGLRGNFRKGRRTPRTKT